jgi:seryl-tRNA synthetase
VLDLKEVAKNFDAVVARLADRGGALDLTRFKELFFERKKLYVELEAGQARKNRVNDEIKLNPEKAKAEGLYAGMKELGKVLKDQEAQLKAIEDEIGLIMMLVPNVPHESVPTGADEHGNQCVRTWGEKPTHLFTPRQHFELGEKLGLLDF